MGLASFLIAIVFAFTVGIFAQVRPDLPQYMMVSGSFTCTENMNAPPCSGVANGIIIGSFQFDNNGIFELYREDAIILNASLIYNREYATSMNTHEIFLAGDNSTSLMCVKFPGNYTMSRHFFKNATYLGVETFNYIKAYAFATNWEFNSVWTNVTAYVGVESEQFIGFNAGPLTYFYTQVIALPGFPPDHFTPPTMTCYTPPL